MINLCEAPRRRVLQSRCTRVLHMLIVSVLLSTTMSFAGIYSEKESKVTISHKNMTVKSILDHIEKTENYIFIYQDDNIDLDRETSIEANNESIFSILDALFKETGNSYKVVDKQIYITKSNEVAPAATVTAVQQRGVSVRGNVVDGFGEPLIGVSIRLRDDATVGVITDFDGNFSLDNVPEGAILHFTYIGMKEEFYTVKSDAFVNITMQDDSDLLDEVVVVGYGVQKKVNLTGAVGIASAKDLESRPVTNVTQALQGMVPGLNISSSTGELDKGMSINIRGQGTIGDGSSGSPLILIDGMEGNMNSVNPQDVESISVLKDAAASSIYGSRAPFGVILITTKKGSIGRVSVNYNNSFRFSNPMNMPKMMDSYTFANFFNSASAGVGWGRVFTDETMQQMLEFQASGGTNTGGLLTDGNTWGKPAGDPFTTAYANTDWYKEIYKSNNFAQEHNVSVNGGTDKATYYLSLGYLDQNGALRHGSDGMDRYNLTAKINTDLASWIKVNYSMRFVRSNNWKPTRFDDNLYDKIGRQTWPNLPVYDENGYYHNSDAESPAMQLAMGGENKSRTDRLYNQGAIILEPIKNWVTNIELNHSYTTWGTKSTLLPYYNHDVQGNIVDTKGDASLYQGDTKENYMNFNAFSTYNFSLDDKHNFKVMAGFQAEQMLQSKLDVRKYGLLVNGMPEFDLTTGMGGNGKERPSIINGSSNEWATAGFFGRLNYDYMGKYLAEVNMRYDGTSRFRRDNRWDLYPSISLGWNISHEEFWEPIADVLHTFKVRGSYGELGNQNTFDWYPTYRTMSLGTSDGYWLQNGGLTNTAYIQNLISTTLTWETVRSWNVGIDWGMFDNRLTGSFDFYTRFTDNMVGPAPELPLILGVTPPKTNNCDLRTDGWELQIGWNDRLKNGFGYGAKLLLSDSQTTIESYPSNTTNSIWQYAAGRKMGEIWGFETVGIAKTQEEMDAHLEKVGGQPFGSEWSAGDIMYANRDGKPGITEGSGTLDDHGDLKVIGNNTPRYHFGLDLHADWKGFDIRAFFQGVLKRDYFQGGSFFWGAVANQWFSLGLEEHQNHFRADVSGLYNEIPANLDSYYPRPLFGGGSNGANKNQKTQSRYLQDASYLRLKNLQIGYTLPSELTSQIGVNNCRVFLSGENLATFTSLSKLFDPETVGAGYGGNAYPLSRTFSFGLNVTF